ncbi:serine/threonine protein kinase [Streptomonospora wellingtoniae]|uniref:Protein kinase domain-containing protein n=1 Tax=Streptomonospora wellingtoniae TaxID=3075544 RepID=A0ABU2KZ38_9ACTN|nr:hypothetical protein [Streptomonospora sp. DSM 45055]MDT0304417.1 hypothetical protein [Streptomonospora sp. DSM 45055]
MSAQHGAGDVPHSPHLRPLADSDPGSVGPYTLTGRLAQDGAGVVYGATDSQGSPIAVRVADERLAADPGGRSALERRIAALQGVAGVCALPVLAADTRAERPWVATGAPSGPSLRSQVEARGPLPREALLALAAGTAEALTGAEPAGLAYGAITPDDVVLAPDGPRLAGLDALGGTGGSAFAAADIPMGRAEWASPETAEGAPLSASGDVFSWGCLVAYAATGRHPFMPAGAADEEADPHLRVREGSPDLDGVPGELAPLIGLALVADPGSRPTAESAYRGLVAYASADDTSQTPTRELADRLRAIIAAGWKADASAVSPDASATGGSGADGAPANGTVPAADAPGPGRPGALATAVVTVSSMAAAMVIGAGGFLTAASFAGEPQAAPSESPSPESPFGSAEQAVSEAAAALKSGESYRAVEDVEGGGTPTAERREHVLTSLEGEPFFQTATLLGDPEAPAAGSTAYVYRPQSELLLRRDFGGGVEGRYVVAALPDESAGDRLGSRTPAVKPFEELMETMRVAERIEGRLNGTPALHVGGRFAPAADGERHSGVRFDLWTDADGHPLRLDYTAGGTEHNWNYSGFGGLESGICGVVDGVPDVERAYLVPTRGDLACDEVRPVVEEYLAIPEADQQAAGYVAEVGEWTCRMSPPPDGDPATRAYTSDVGACERGPAERVDLVLLDETP